MAWLTGYPDEAPQVPNGPCDPIGGTHTTIALQLTLEHRRRTGEGMLVEVPQVGGRALPHRRARRRVRRVRRPARASGQPRAPCRTTRRVPHHGRRCRRLTGSLDSDRGQDGRPVARAPAHARRSALGRPTGARKPTPAGVPRPTRSTTTSRSGRRPGRPTTWWSSCGRPACPSRRSSSNTSRTRSPSSTARGFWQDITHPVTGLNRHGGYPTGGSCRPRGAPSATGTPARPARSRDPDRDRAQ